LEDLDPDMFVNGQGLTNGPDHSNGNGLTSFKWRVVGESNLKRIKTVGMFKRLVRWLMG